MKKFKKAILFFALQIISINSNCDNPRNEYRPEHKKAPSDLGAYVEDFLKNASEMDKKLFFQGAAQSGLKNPADETTPADLHKNFALLEQKKQKEFLALIDEKLLKKYYTEEISNKLGLEEICNELTNLLADDARMQTLPQNIKILQQNFEALYKTIKSLK